MKKRMTAGNGATGQQDLSHGTGAHWPKWLTPWTCLALGAIGASCGGTEGPDDPRSPHGPDIAGSQVSAAGEGLLEVVNPENPERPLFQDFGEMIYGEETVWTTELENTGTGPVVIQNAQAACGCTLLLDMTITDPNGVAGEPITSFDQSRRLAVIPAGSTVRMRIKLMTLASTPNQRKLAQFRLITDSRERPYLTFELSFLPKRAFLLGPSEARLLSVPTSHGQVERIKVLVDVPGEPARVLRVLSVPEGLEAELVTESFAGEFVWFVDIAVPPMSPLGAIRGDVVLETTDPEGNGTDGRLPIPVLAQVVPDVVANPNLAALRGFDRTLGAEAKGRLRTLLPGAQIAVVSSRIEGADPAAFEVETSPIKPGDDGRSIEWQYLVRVKPGYPEGYVNGEVVFALDEPYGGTPEGAPNDEIRVRISGIARAPAPGS